MLLILLMLLMLLMRWCCWCADVADVLMLLMLLMRGCCWCCWCCWCADAVDAADALMLLIRWYCWCTDALMLLNQDQDQLADLSIAFCSSYLFWRHSLLMVKMMLMTCLHSKAEVWPEKVFIQEVCTNTEVAFGWQWMKIVGWVNSVDWVKIVGGMHKHRGCLW